MNETKFIQEYSLLDFVQKLEQAITEGYVSNVHLNEGVPQITGHCFSILMYKKEPKFKSTVETFGTDTNDVTIKQTSVPPQKPRGRPVAK
jgi:hypothetical protein